MALQKLLRPPARVLDQREQQVLGAHKLVAKLLNLIVRADKHLAQRTAQLRLARGAGNARQLADLAVHLHTQLLHIHPDAAQHLRHNPLRLLDERLEQVQRLHLKLLAILRDLLRLDYRFLCFLCESVDIHRLLPL